MKTLKFFSLALLASFVLFISCKKSETVMTEEIAKDSIASKIISSSAAVEKNDNGRKFIRTADLKFKVKDVAQSTYKIENITSKFGGYVAFTNLQSTISEKNQTKISEDSLLVSTIYQVENNITIKVPNQQLDTIVKIIAKQIDFLDYRIIKADDVSLQMISNELTQKRNNETKERFEKAIDSKGKKLNSIIESEEKLAQKKEENDSNKLNTLFLKDQVNFSTLTLSIYQNETVKNETIYNVNNKNLYKPHLGLQILESIKSGWYILESFIAFIFQLWSVILIFLLGLFLYKRYFKK